MRPARGFGLRDFRSFHPANEFCGRIVVEHQTEHPMEFPSRRGVSRIEVFEGRLVVSATPTTSL